LGQYPLSLAFNRQAIAIREPVLKPPHAELARSYRNMAQVYRALGDEASMSRYTLQADQAGKKQVAPPPEAEP